MSINAFNSEKIPTCANITLEKLSSTQNENNIPVSLDKRISKANFVLCGFPTMNLI